MADDAKQQGTVQIALRISPDLRERVKAAADANNRSVNSELTATLEEKYPAPSVDDALEKILAIMSEIIAIPDRDERQLLWREAIEMAADAARAQRDALPTDAERARMDETIAKIEAKKRLPT